MKSKPTTQIQIDENQRNCIVSGLIYLQLEMRKEMIDKPEDHDRNQWLTQQIEMMSGMIDHLDRQFKRN